jgi:hypothetical protein
MKMTNGMTVLLTSLVVRLLSLNLFPAWIPRATFPLGSGLRLVAFSSHVSLISPVKKPRSEALELPSDRSYA